MPPRFNFLQSLYTGASWAWPCSIYHVYVVQIKNYMWVSCYFSDAGSGFRTVGEKISWKSQLRTYMKMWGSAVTTLRLLNAILEAAGWKEQLYQPSLMCRIHQNGWTWRGRWLRGVNLSPNVSRKVSCRNLTVIKLLVNSVFYFSSKVSFDKDERYVIIDHNMQHGYSNDRMFVVACPLSNIIPALSSNTTQSSTLPICICQWTSYCVSHVLLWGCSSPWLQF